MLPLSIGQTHTARSAGPSAVAGRVSGMASANPAERHALGLWLATLVSIGVLFALGHVWLRLKVSDVGYRLDATRQAVERLRQEANELVADSASLDNSTRLEELARTRLGLQRPTKGQEAVLP